MDEGTYKAKAVDVELGYAQTGTPQVAVLFEVLEGDEAGSRITWYGYFTDGTSQRTIESLRNCGWKGNDLSELEPSLLPDDVQIVVQHQEYNGAMRAKVAWVNKVGAGTIAMKERMTPEQRKQFAAQMKGACMAIGGTQAASPARQAPAQRSAVPAQRPAAQRQTPGAAPPPADPLDDIPF